MMPSSTSVSDVFDRAALLRVVEPIVRAHGAELVDLELKPEQLGWVLRITIEKIGAAELQLSSRDAAVDLELCASVSRDLNHALDMVDLIPHTYHLEVSSPGLERRLRGERDLTRFSGHLAKLKLREPVGGQRVLKGTLDGVADGKLRLIVGSRTHEIPLSSVDSARLVFEFGNGGAGAAVRRNTKQRKH